MAVDVPLPHLDTLFDYLIPAKLDSQAKVGVRVRIKFNQKNHDGYLVEIAEETDVPKSRLLPLRSIVSDEVVMPKEQIELIRAVADHCAGNFVDVARLAVPPRHALTENAPQNEWPAPQKWGNAPTVLPQYLGGESFLKALEEGVAPRAFWQVVPTYPGHLGDWGTGFIEAAAKVLAAGKSVLVVIPERKHIDRLRSRFAEAFGLGAIAVLHDGLGKSERYRSYLAVIRGQAKIVIGTRTALYAPIKNLGLLICWDDSNEFLNERLAPYPKGRDVAAIRVAQENCALMFASWYRSCEIEQWVQNQWLYPIEMPNQQVRREVCQVRAISESDETLRKDPLAGQLRIPSLAFRTIRNGLERGPVLVQVPRKGYLMALRCDLCGAKVRCQVCQGPMKRDRDSTVLSCSWCGRTGGRFRCTNCRGETLRAPVVGATRTAEELGRAFPGFRLIDSSGTKVLDEIGSNPALVIATPGAEPIAENGYAAAVILDTSLSLNRQTLRASEDAFRRFIRVIALVRGNREGGRVCLVGPASDRVLQSLIRLDVSKFATSELADRQDAHFPPAFAMASVEGELEAITQIKQAFDGPESVEILGPVETGELASPEVLGGKVSLYTLTFRVPSSERGRLAKALKAAQSIRSAKGGIGSLRVYLD